MEYILNKSNVLTTGHSKINDIHLDLDFPLMDTSLKYKVVGTSYKEYEGINFESRLGLSFPKSHNIDIDIDKTSDILICNTICSTVDNIGINVRKGIDSKITIKYDSKEDIYHVLKINLNLEEGSNVILNLINLISTGSKSFISFENTLNDNSNLEVNLVDLGGNVKINNYYTKNIGNCSKATLNNIYIGHLKDIVDMNYYDELLGNKAEGYINVSGVLKDKSSKNFKGIIDFKEGSKKSIGKELEKVILLSTDAKSKSLPILLCHEEDVEGAHSSSVGKLDNEMLFYMMSRGISLKEAEKLIIKSEFDIALNKLKPSLCEDINKVIENI